MTDIPTAVWSGSFNLFGVEIRCHVLSDGQRIVDAESLENLFAARPGPIDVWDEEDGGDIEEFARWLRNVPKDKAHD